MTFTYSNVLLQLDVTSSDKENKGVWSTSSSSDSSLRSSPQTEGSHEMPLHLPIHGGESGKETADVVVTRITGDGGKANGDHRNVPATIVEEDAAEAIDTTSPVAETGTVEKPPAVPTTGKFCFVLFFQKLIVTSLLLLSGL